MHLDHSNPEKDRQANPNQVNPEPLDEVAGQYRHEPPGHAKPGIRVQPLGLLDRIEQREESSQYHETQEPERVEKRHVGPNSNPDQNRQNANPSNRCPVHPRKIWEILLPTSGYVDIVGPDNKTEETCEHRQKIAIQVKLRRN